MNRILFRFEGIAASFFCSAGASVAYLDFSGGANVIFGVVNTVFNTANNARFSFTTIHNSFLHSVF